MTELARRSWSGCEFTGGNVLSRESSFQYSCDCGSITWKNWQSHEISTCSVHIVAQEARTTWVDTTTRALQVSTRTTCLIPELLKMSTKDSTPKASEKDNTAFAKCLSLVPSLKMLILQTSSASLIKLKTLFTSALFSLYLALNSSGLMPAILWIDQSSSIFLKSGCSHLIAVVDGQDSWIL